MQSALLFARLTRTNDRSTRDELYAAVQRNPGSNCRNGFTDRATNGIIPGDSLTFTGGQSMVEFICFVVFVLLTAATAGMILGLDRLK